MASRGFSRKQASQREVKEIFGKFTIGASGAPTLVGNEVSQGIASVTRNSAGNYTVTLDDKYVAFMSADITLLSSSLQSMTKQILAESVSSAKTIQFSFSAPDGGLAAAIIVANELKTDYTAHIADTSDHTSGADSTNTISAADASDLASLITLVSELLTDYDAHDDDAELASSWAYHAAQEAADHSPASTTAPTNLAECIEAIDDLKVKFNAHDADDTAHGVGSQYQVSASNSYLNVETDPSSGSIVYVKFDLKNSSFRG